MADLKKLEERIECVINAFPYPDLVATFGIKKAIMESVCKDNSGEENITYSGDDSLMLIYNEDKNIDVIFGANKEYIGYTVSLTNSQKEVLERKDFSYRVRGNVIVQGALHFSGSSFASCPQVTIFDLKGNIIKPTMWLNPDGTVTFYPDDETKSLFEGLHAETVRPKNSRGRVKAEK